MKQSRKRNLASKSVGNVSMPFNFLNADKNAEGDSHAG